MKSNVGEKFSDFFQNWVSQLEIHTKQLQSLSKEEGSTIGDVSDHRKETQALVSKVTQHFKEYYTVKWALAREDVLAFYSPIWASPLEKAYSWVTGWKPSMIFKLVDSIRKTRLPGPSLAELTQEQLRKIEGLRMKIKLEEEKVEREMERQQVAMGDRKIVELVRLASRIKKGGEVEGLVEVALKGLMAGLEKVMKAADCVRLRALKGVLDVLSPLQSVEFLAGTCMLQIQLRQWGKKKECVHC